jgi:hypothetical protein
MAPGAMTVHQTEAIMQESIRTGGDKQSRLSNPLLDLAVAGLEAQLKAWQAYQVEGTCFVAKRMRANLEHLRALGHCCDAPSMGECQRSWLRDIQKDYGEECGRIVATTFALSFADLAGLGWLFGQRTAKGSPQPKPEPQPGPRPKSQSGLQAAA